MLKRFLYPGNPNDAVWYMRFAVCLGLDLLAVGTSQGRVFLFRISQEEGAVTLGETAAGIGTDEPQVHEGKNHPGDGAKDSLKTLDEDTVSERKVLQCLWPGCIVLCFIIFPLVYRPPLSSPTRLCVTRNARARSGTSASTGTGPTCCTPATTGRSGAGTSGLIPSRMCNCNVMYLNIGSIFHFPVCNAFQYNIVMKSIEYTYRKQYINFCHSPRNTTVGCTLFTQMYMYNYTNYCMHAIHDSIFNYPQDIILTTNQVQII